jgi:hypothetical protein
MPVKNSVKKSVKAAPFVQPAHVVCRVAARVDAAESACCRLEYEFAQSIGVRPPTTCPHARLIDLHSAPYGPNVTAFRIAVPGSLPWATDLCHVSVSEPYC